MKIEIILTESEIAEEFRDSLEAHDLPEKFFYWTPPAAGAWLSLVRDSFYDGMRQIWKQMPSHLLAHIGHFGRSVPVISFGAGSGAADRVLIQSLVDAGKEPRYVPVDASQTLLEIACAAAEDADIETIGIKADISSPPHLVYASDAAEGPRIFLMAGSTLGSFDPLEEIRYLAQVLQKGDLLAVDGEIYSGDSLSRRQNPAVERFTSAPLTAVGFTPEDGSLRFEDRRDERLRGLNLIACYFQAARDIHTTTGIDIVRGERIATKLQYTYSAHAFRWLLCEHAGLRIIEEVPSQDGRFLSAICMK